MSNKRIRSFLLGVIIVLAICAIVELSCNFKLLRLPETERGTRALEASEVELEGFEETEDGYLLKAGVEDARITWKFESTYIDKFQYSIDSDGLFDARIVVHTQDIYGGKTHESVEDNSPLLVTESTVNLKMTATAISLRTDGAIRNGESQDLLISAPMIVNRPYINEYRMGIVFLLGMMIVLLVVYRDLFLGKLEYGFAIVAFTVGLSMLLCFPSLKVGWDEEAHFKAAYRLTALVKIDAMPNEILGNMIGDVYGWPLNQPGSYEETKLLDELQNDIWENDVDDVQFEGCTRGFATAGTIFQAFAIAIARFLNLPWSGFYFLGRFVNLLTYVISMFFVIRILPIGKRVTTFISLMPTSIFLAVCFTYDVVVYAFILMGIALVLREWMREDRKVDTRMILLAYMFFMWGCFSKQVYAPLILVMILVPMDRFKSRKQALTLKTLSVVVMLVLFGSMAVAALMGSYGSGDSRGGGEVSNGSQMQLILAQPLNYAALLWKSMKDSFFYYTLGDQVFQTMGHLPSAGFTNLIPIAAVSVIMVDQENTGKLKKRDRVLLFLLIAGVAALVWSALYVQFNEVGATWIGGVQARYYRPFLPLLYMVFGNRLLKVNVSKERINAYVLGVSSLIMIGTVIQVMNLFRV